MRNSRTIRTGTWLSPIFPGNNPGISQLAPAASIIHYAQPRYGTSDFDTAWKSRSIGAEDGILIRFLGKNELMVAQKPPDASKASPTSRRFNARRKNDPRSLSLRTHIQHPFDSLLLAPQHSEPILMVVLLQVPLDLHAPILKRLPRRILPGQSGQ